MFKGKLMAVSATVTTSIASSLSFISGAVGPEELLEKVKSFSQYEGVNKGTYGEEGTFVSFENTCIPYLIFCFNSINNNEYMPELTFFYRFIITEQSLSFDFSNFEKNFMNVNIMRFDGDLVKENKEYILFLIDLIKKNLEKYPQNERSNDLRDMGSFFQEYIHNFKVSDDDISLDYLKSFSLYDRVKWEEDNGNSFIVDFSENDYVKRLIFTKPGVIQTYRLAGFQWFKGSQGGSCLMVRLVNNSTGEKIVSCLHDIQTDGYYRECARGFFSIVKITLENGRSEKELNEKNGNHSEKTEDLKDQILCKKSFDSSEEEILEKKLSKDGSDLDDKKSKKKSMTVKKSIYENDNNSIWEQSLLNIKRKKET